jgi:glycosyltransferase involved in cell wall biosynthesis
MMRLLLSATTDLDADAHVRRLTAQGARVADVVTREWPLIARAALRLRRAPLADELITVGEAALLAATFARRTPSMHILVGAPTAAELIALRRRARVRVVVSSLSAWQRLRAAGVAAARIESIEPPVDPMPARAEARARLGRDADAVVVTLPGSIRPGSGHRLAIWASALLAYRDASWRFLVAGRGDDHLVRMFIRATVPPDLHAFHLVDENDALEAIAAADIALFAGEGMPERYAYEACARAGVAIVAPRTIIDIEHLPVAATFDPFTARQAARAVLHASDALGLTQSPGLAPLQL